MYETRKKVFTIVIFFLMLFFSYSYMGHSVPKAEVITDVISYPLPTVPEPVLLGDEFIVKVKASDDAKGWIGRLASQFGSSNVNLVDSEYSSGEWVLTFQAPNDLTPELYNLTLSFYDPDIVEETHSRCIWILDEWPRTLTISHISDLHLYHGKDHFANYINEINFLDPDLIIATGDIIQEESVADHWNYLQSLLPRLEAPSFLLPGNHDHTGASGKLYKQYCGLLNYSVNLGNFFFLAMDSDYEDEDLLNHIDWVESELQKHPNKTKILGLHLPIFAGTDTPIQGGNIYGHWNNMTNIANYVYFDWLTAEGGTPVQAASKLLRVIEENDVRLILAGDCHEDFIYILNDRHYFFSVSPVGGGLPPGVYHGSRIISINSEGNVTLDWYAENRLKDPPNSIPVIGLNYWYSSKNDYSETSVTATIVNDLDMPIDDGKLEFHVCSDYPISEYEFSIDPEYYEVYTTDNGHIFCAYYDVSPKSTIDVTISTVEDKTPPEVSLTIKDVELGRTLNGCISVSDDDWGVKNVEAYYSNDVMATWSSFDLTFNPTINGDVYDITYPEYIYTFSVPASDVKTGLMIKVDAWDFAGNMYTFQSTDLTYVTQYSLKVNTAPSGISIKINGSNMNTPYSADFDEGKIITLIVLEEVTLDSKTYIFKDWSDGKTSLERIITLDDDIGLTANYLEKEQPSQPSGGLPLPTEFVLMGLLVSLIIFWIFKNGKY